MAAKKIRVGWTTARVEALADCTLQCFRCHNCGSPEHRVALGTSSPQYPFCSDWGKPSGHRMGTFPLSPPDTKKRWTLKRLDENALMAASLAVAWPKTPAGPVVDVEEEAVLFLWAILVICDTAMLRRRTPGRWAPY